MTPRMSQLTWKSCLSSRIRSVRWAASKNGQIGFVHSRDSGAVVAAPEISLYFVNVTGSLRSFFHEGEGAQHDEALHDNGCCGCVDGRRPRSSEREGGRC